MVKTQNKTQVKTDKTIVQTVSTETTVQNYFLTYVKNNGYTTKSYNQLAECSVQLNNRVKLYYVPLKNGNLKLCLYGVQIPDKQLDGVQVLNQNTYPNKYTQRVYFKGCKLSNVQTFLDNILQQVCPKVDNVQ